MSTVLITPESLTTGTPPSKAAGHTDLHGGPNHVPGRPPARLWLPFCGWIYFQFHHFVVCSVVIALLAMLDTYLVIRYQECILVMEENPVCLFLIKMDSETLVFFLLGKFVGTIGAIASMLAVYRWRERIGAVVVQAITLFQIGLITYQLVA